MNLRYTSRSRDEIRLAVDWYEQQQQGLGLEFLDSLERSIVSIADNPFKYMNLYKNFRRCLLGKFPFSVFFTIEDDLVVVHSVFHNSQNPGRRP